MQDITEENKEERFRLSKKYRRWSKERLNKIYYSDESNICLAQNGVQFVRKYDHEDWTDERFRKVKKLFPLSINIWMMISYRGVERIKLTSKTWIDGDYYRKNILQKYVINNEHLQKDSEFGGYFQQDQARSHIAQETLSYLNEHNVNYREWPPKGADLSPIEICFAEIQRRAKDNYDNIKTQDQLWEFVSTIKFEKEFDEFIGRCYDSIKDKWEKVFLCDGGVI